MSVERISKATTYDTTRNIVRTNEVELLIDGDITAYEMGFRAVYEVVGQSNIDQYRERTKDYAYTNNLSVSDRTKYLSELLDWRNHLIGRELAIRSMEVSMVTGIPIISEGLHALTAGSPYESSSTSHTAIDMDIIKEYVKIDREDKNPVSIGDRLAVARIDNERALMGKINDQVGVLSNNTTNRTALRPAFRKRALNLIRDASTAGGLATTDRTFIGHLLELEEADAEHLPQWLWDARVNLAALTRHVKTFRANSLPYKLALASDAKYIYTPSNKGVYERYGLSDSSSKANKAVITVTDEERAAAAERANELATARKTQRQQAEAERLENEARNAAHDAPILERLNELADEYNGLIGNFTGQANRSLRDKGLVGKDSLQYALLRVKGIDPNAVDRIVRVYDHLYELASFGGESVQILTDEMLKLEELRAEFVRYHQANPLRGNGVPKLEASVNPDISWLGEHWRELRSAISDSRHARMITDEHRRIIGVMLGVESIDKIEDIQDDSSIVAPMAEEAELVVQEVVVAKESPLVQANRLAEQLNWIVLPDEEITTDELTDIAEKVTRSNRSGKRKEAVVERYRMEALLRLRDEFGGRLYRSDERMLGDDENLYFALRFKHLGDENHYVIAENPVYGNATYIMREEILPLQSGETALAALKLYRRDVRELGAQRIIHGTPSTDEHVDKIYDRLETLSSAKQEF